MQLELKHIKGGQLEQDYQCAVGDFPELQELANTGDCVYRDPIRLLLRFIQSGRMVEVSGHIQATLELTCGGCLGSFEYALAEDFDLTFVPEVEPTEPALEQELETDELGLIPYREDRLELLTPVQEQLLLAVPMHPLCSATCRGLCPVCGVDLNTSSCRCEKKIFNNKFGALAQIKGKAD
ncbi:MAG: DUF177 domain-containing protein [Pelovirga sp.]